MRRIQHKTYDYRTYMYLLFAVPNMLVYCKFLKKSLKCTFLANENSRVHFLFWKQSIAFLQSELVQYMIYIVIMIV
jgi:hypothetical protein